MPNNKCEYCGGSQIINGLTVSAFGSHDAGLRCKPKKESFLRWLERNKRETLFAELCTSCGTVKRLYVKDPKRDWVV